MPANEFAYGIELERRLTPRLGIELGILQSSVPVNRTIGSATLFGDASVRPITAGLDIHLRPEGRIDLTLTPLAGYAFYDDLRFRIDGGDIMTLPVNDDFVWGVRAAAGAPLGESRWGVSLAVRYLDAALRTSFDGAPLAIALDPLILSAGLSLRWPRTASASTEEEANWPFYRLSGSSITFRPRENLLAVVFTRGPPDSRSLADLIAEFSEELPLEPLASPAAGESIRLFRITRPTEPTEPTGPTGMQRLRESMTRLLGRDVRVGTVVNADPGRVTVLDNHFNVRFREDLPPREVEAIVAAAGGRILRPFIQAPNAYQVEFSRGDYKEHLRIVEAWHQRGLLVYGEPDLKVQIVDLASPDDPAIDSEGRLDLELQSIDSAGPEFGNIDDEFGLGRPHVQVATLDRGIQRDHPDLGGDLTDGTPQIAQCFDFRRLISCTHAAYKPDNDHGMQVYGIISARANNGIGIDGIAPNVHHIAMKRQDYYDAEYLDALLWAAGFQIDGPPAGWPARPSSPGADIISLSHRIYLREPPGLMDDTFRYLTTYGRDGRGTLLIYAAGNESISIANNYPFPAHPLTMAISNSDPPDAEGIERRNATSNFGPQIDLCARGAGVISLNAGGGTRSFGSNATSAAAPRVAAAAALMLSAQPELTWIDLRDILRDTAVRIDPDDGGWTADGFSELCGFGRLDLGAAVQAAAAFDVGAGDHVVKEREAEQSTN